MNLARTVVAIVAFMGVSHSAVAADCDGNLQVSGPMGCTQALSHEYNQQLINLYRFGLLDPKKQSIRGACDCTTKGNFVYCSASFDVHQCFHGASGTLWFSAESAIQGGIFASWDTASSNSTNDLYGHKAAVAKRAAEGLINQVKAKTRR